jgi:hypothetical protein
MNLTQVRTWVPTFLLLPTNIYQFLVVEDSVVRPTPATVPATRVKLSHDLPRFRPRTQQRAPPRPTSGLGLSLGLGRNRELRLARPQASASASASGGVTTSPDLSLDHRRSLRLARPGPQTDYATGDTSLPYS